MSLSILTSRGNTNHETFRVMESLSSVSECLRKIPSCGIVLTCQYRARAGQSALDRRSHHLYVHHKARRKSASRAFWISILENPRCICRTLQNWKLGTLSRLPSVSHSSFVHDRGPRLRLNGSRRGWEFKESDAQIFQRSLLPSYLFLRSGKSSRRNPRAAQWRRAQGGIWERSIALRCCDEQTQDQDPSRHRQLYGPRFYFSAGNSYVYCASRSLFGLVLEGKAPRFLTKCTKQGVPIHFVGVTFAITLLSFLRVSHNAAVVLQWFVNLVTASQLINFSVMAFAFICWREPVTLKGWTAINCRTTASGSHSVLTTPWLNVSSWLLLEGIRFSCQVNSPKCIRYIRHKADIKTGQWDIPTFLFSYAMIGVFPVIFIGWKLVKRTNWLQPHEVVLRTVEVDEVDEYTANYVERVPCRQALQLKWDSLRVSSGKEKFEQYRSQDQQANQWHSFPNKYM